MATYVTMMKLTDRGAQSIKDAPRRIKEGVQAWEAMGGKMLGFWVTAGEYDYITVGECPSDDVALTFSAALGSQGNVRTTMLKAWTVDEFTRLVAQIP